MKYRVIVLEDDRAYGKIEANSIIAIDPDAELEIVKSTSEAIDHVTRSENPHPIGYVLVDLYMTADGEDQQGLDFIKWLWLESGQPSVPVFVLSSVRELIHHARRVLGELPVRGTVEFGNRLESFEAWRENFSAFITKARANLVVKG